MSDLRPTAAVDWPEQDLPHHRFAPWLAAGSVLAALGLFVLPWAIVAGERRTGLSFAAVCLSLPEADLTLPARAVGVAWFGAATAAIVALTLGWVGRPAHASHRRVGRTLAVLSAALFAALTAAVVWSPLRGQPVGALVTVLGTTAGAAWWFVAPRRIPSALVSTTQEARS